jgi:hypothetical protein
LISTDQLDPEAYEKFFAKLNNNDTVTIGIFGGSMTDGEECVPKNAQKHMTQRECAWSERLLRYLRGAYPYANIVRRGFAVSSSDSIFGLTSFRQDLSVLTQLALDLWYDDDGGRQQGEIAVRVCLYCLSLCVCICVCSCICICVRVCLCSVLTLAVHQYSNTTLPWCHIHAAYSTTP